MAASRSHSRSRSAVTAVALATLGTALGGLLALGPASPVAADGGTGVVHPEWGHVDGHDAVLKRGCHRYSYSYSVTPPPGDWAIETFLTGPGPRHGTGKVALANGAFLDGYDPMTGTATFSLCRATTRYGKFAIKARLSVQNGPNSYTEGWLPVAHFRLRAPRHHH